MTPEEAVVILNREVHRGQYWHIEGEHIKRVVTGRPAEVLSGFEVIAIAEKYEYLRGTMAIDRARRRDRIMQWPGGPGEPYGT